MNHVDGYYFATGGLLEWVDSPELSNAGGVEMLAGETVEMRGGRVLVFHRVNGRTWLHGMAWLLPNGKSRFTNAGRMHRDDVAAHMRTWQAVAA